jgi:hypothetical protein
MTKIITFIVVGIGAFLVLGLAGSMIVFNTFIKPNLATVTEPIATISTPIIEEGEQIVQEGIEQGAQESQNIISEIIDTNIAAIREEIISAFTIGGDEESQEQEGE